MCAAQLTYLTSIIQTPRGKHTPYMCGLSSNNLRYINEIKIALEIKKKSILQTSSTSNHAATKLRLLLNMIRYSIPFY